MFASFLYTTLALAACANAIHITLPLHITTLKQCEQYPINVGGASKLNVEVLNAADECGDAIKSWMNIAEQSTVHWTVNEPVGKSIIFMVEETGSDAEEWSNVFKIVKGDDTSCLTASNSSSARVSASAPGASAPLGGGVPQPTDGTDGSGDDSGLDGGPAINVGTNAASRTSGQPALVLPALFATLLFAAAQL